MSVIAVLILTSALLPSAGKKELSSDSTAVKTELAAYLVSCRDDASTVCRYYENRVREVMRVAKRTIRSTEDSVLTHLDSVGSKCLGRIALFESELRRSMVEHYVRFYSLRELERLKRFYGSPLGRKMVDIDNEIQRRIFDPKHPRFDLIMSRFQREIEPYLEISAMLEYLDGE